MDKIALAVMRLQPLHNGHKLLIDTMIDESDLAIVGIGSINKHDDRNPYSFEVRQEMIRSIYGGDLIQIVALNDIGAVSKIEWADYVLGEVERRKLPKPTVYYAGSIEDGDWFCERLPIRIVDRAMIDICATKVREELSYNRRPTLVPDEILKIIGFGQ